jgi:hypothetical protein
VDLMAYIELPCRHGRACEFGLFLLEFCCRLGHAHIPKECARLKVCVQRQRTDADRCCAEMASWPRDMDRPLGKFARSEGGVKVRVEDFNAKLQARFVGSRLGRGSTVRKESGIGSKSL